MNNKNMYEMEEPKISELPRLKEKRRHLKRWAKILFAMSEILLIYTCAKLAYDMIMFDLGPGEPYIFPLFLINLVAVAYIHHIRSEYR